MDLVETLVTIHGLWRWLVLLAALVALAGGAAVWMGQLRWPLADRLAMVYTIVLDIQVLLGVLVWLSSLISGKSLNWYTLALHPILMLAAVGIAHIARTRAGRATTDPARAQTVTLGVLISLVIIILAIPGFIFPANP